MTPPTVAPPAPSRLFQWPWMWWFMVAALVIVAAVRLRLLNLPLERDEGEYAYAGQLIRQGIPPYQLAYNMKFPGTYAAYAVIMALFGQTPAGIHFGVLCLTTLTALMLFWLGKKMLDPTAGIVAASAYAVLAASPSMLGLAGHATHFCAFFATAGLCAMWQARQKRNWLVILAAGLLFGTAVLMKQQAALIALWASLAWTVWCFRQTEIPSGKRLAALAVFGIGIVLPFALCCLILWHAGVFRTFWFWTVDYAWQYASVVPLSYAPQLFWKGFLWVTAPGFLLWLMAGAGLILLWLDERPTPSRGWLLGFCFASALAVCPDFYFRKHYFLIALPAVALLGGVAVSATSHWWAQRNRISRLNGWPVWICVAAVAVTIAANRGIWFRLTPVQATCAIYGPDPFPEAEVVAAYIREKSPPAARLVVLGSEPEIYFLARRHSATGYIYTYGLMEPQPFARRMQDEMIGEIETSAPEFVVFADNPLLSWARRPDSDLKIFEWWNSYQTNYTLVGVADVISTTETKFAWGAEEAARYGKIRGLGLEIFHRK
ncbi:MAG: glycosyltransferase family 39 protein [Verrucomicrobiota bacterium]